MKMISRNGARVFGACQRLRREAEKGLAGAKAVQLFLTFLILIDHNSHQKHFRPAESPFRTLALWSYPKKAIGRTPKVRRKSNHGVRMLRACLTSVSSQNGMLQNPTSDQKSRCHRSILDVSDSQNRCDCFELCQTRIDSSY